MQPAEDPADTEIVHLPAEVMTRVEALSELQKKRDEHQAALEEERKQLDLKYAAIYAPIYAERAGAWRMEGGAQRAWTG